MAQLMRCTSEYSQSSKYSSGVSSEDKSGFGMLNESLGERYNETVDQNMMDEKDDVFNLL